MINNASLHSNLDKYCEFISWARWFPDLFYDLITPKTGGIRLDFDQRIFLRCGARFASIAGVFPRGYGKTFLEVMGMYHAAIFYPDITLAMTAQTKKNAASILQAKHDEIIKFYPLMENELSEKPSFTKNNARVRFKSGGVIDILANHPNSKGQRRNRADIEESNLIDKHIYEEVIEPIPNVPRRTIGKLAAVDPEEMNGQIHFFTTPGFKGSDEYYRNLEMLEDMAELRGKIVLGADWQLACEFGRGETRSKILDKKRRLSSINFAQNYGGTWTGTTENAIVNINKLLALRVLEKAELEGEKGYDYIVSMDVAQSFKKDGNRSSIGVYKLITGKNGDLKNVDQVYLYNLPNGLGFEAQAIELKRTALKYSAAVVVVDGNGLGKGLLGKCLEELIDPVTGEVFECWDTINTEDVPKVAGSKKKVFVVESQGKNTDIILSFMNAVEDGILRLLIKKSDADYDVTDTDFFERDVAPFLQTDAFIEEVSNLKQKVLPGNNLTVEKVVGSFDKDRYSTCAYALYYIFNFWNSTDTSEYDYVFRCD